jgi:hypothetical protein
MSQSHQTIRQLPEQLPRPDVGVNLGAVIHKIRAGSPTMFPDTQQGDAALHTPTSLEASFRMFSPQLKGLRIAEKVVSIALLQSAALGLAACTSTTSPAISAPATPGSTVSSTPNSTASSETTNSRATPSAESTSYVRKNSLPQLSADAAFQKWGVPSAAKISALVTAANSPEAAVAAAKAADQDDVENYVESWLYGDEATKTNDFVDKLYTQNPSLFPKTLLADLGDPNVGPGKDLLKDPRKTLNGVNIQRVIVSRIAQDPRISDSDKLKAIAVLEASMDGPDIDNYSETRATTTPDLSVMYYADDMKAAKALMARRSTDPLGLIPLFEYDAAVQATIRNPKVTANLATPSGIPVSVMVLAVAGRVYGDSADMKTVVWAMVDDDSNSYIFPQNAGSGSAARFTGESFDSWLAYHTTKEGLFTGVKVVTS